MTKQVLIICYSFPPYPGIGGRRWAKFAKYLVARGYQVHVITSIRHSNEESQWYCDVIHDNIIVHSLPSKYPMVFFKQPATFIKKVEYRFWLLFFKFYSKGVLFDRAIFWRTQLIKLSRKIIEEHKIKNVIITIPPFKLAYYGLELKKIFPDLNLIVDFRDPWTDNKSYHGFKDLSNKRLEHEVKIEKEILNKADYIITVSDEMTQNLKQKSTKVKNIITINNGYDSDDILTIKSSNKNDGKIKFIYAGTLYPELEYIFNPLLSYLEYLKIYKSTLFEKIQFDFYGESNKYLVDKIKTADNSSIKLHKQISLNEIQKKISQADFCLLFSAPDHSFAFNTKFFEYIANRKPIILFSNKGKTSDFINLNKLGFHISPDNFKEDFTKLISLIEDSKLEYNQNFDIEQYSLNTITNKVENILVY